MEFEDQEDQEEQEEGISLPVSASYENSRIKMSGGGGVTGIGGVAGGAEGPISNRKAISKYRECLKNHAVGIGGHAVDGCGEFMAAGEEGTLDALKCAACNCHRNFHRKETAGENFHQFSPYYRTPPPGYLHIAAAAGMHHRPALALPSTSGGAAGHSREDQEDISNPSGGTRKRFRTKFTQEQKDKMLAFAERLGWRIQKQDEAAVQQFCMETCVKRHVLKVWMHNNKHTLGISNVGENNQ